MKGDNDLSMSELSKYPVVVSVLSGLIGALLVFALNEYLNYSREKTYRKSLLALLLCELQFNLEIFDNLFVIQRPPIGSQMFSRDIWFRYTIELARYLDADTLGELYSLYNFFLKVENNQIAVTVTSHPTIRTNITQLQSKVAKIAQIPLTGSK